jgi:hypothetical protein
LKQAGRKPVSKAKPAAPDEFDRVIEEVHMRVIVGGADMSKSKKCIALNAVGSGHRETGLLGVHVSAMLPFRIHNSETRLIC